MISPFSAIINSVRYQAIEVLLARAVLFNRLAKASPRGTAARRVLYLQKSRAVSRLVELGAGYVEDSVPMGGVVTVRLVNGRRLHLPIGSLPREHGE